MPIYEYVCKGCEHRFETLVIREGRARCPQCESKRLEKQYSAFAVGAAKGKGRVAKSAPSAGACGSCCDPRGPGSCAMN